MKIKLTKEQQEKLRAVGLSNVGKHVEVEQSVFNKNYAEWKKTLPLAGHSTLTLKAISTCLWTKRSGEHRKDFVLPQPKQEVKVQAKFPRWELRIIIGLLVLILGWLVFALPAKAQFSQIVFIEWKDGGTAVTDGFFTFPFTIDCTTNVTCTSDGSTLTLSASAGSGGRWDQLTAPTGAMSLVSNADAEIMTWDFQSDFSTDRAVFQQTTGNPTGGAVLLVTATDVDALLVQFGASNGVQITQAGALTAIGSGAITATLGDSATSFFSSGTLEVGIGGTGAAAFTLGSVVFAGASGVYTQDNANFFWDDTLNTLGIGTATPTHTLDVVGEQRITHVAGGAADHALEIANDSAGFGDVKAIDIFYDTGAIAAGEDEGVILINIDESSSTGGTVVGLEVLSTTGSAKVYGTEFGVGVNPVIQLSGAFGDMDSALVIAVDSLTAFTTSDPAGANNVDMFVADDDTITIGDAAKYEEIEFLLEVVSSVSTQPTFEYSTGDGTWATFTPTDGTSGMRNSGIVAWLVGDIPGWLVGTGTEFLIRITRTRNNISTVPTEDLVQIVAGIEYTWDSDGNINVLSLQSGSGAEIADAGFIRCANAEACVAWELATPGTDKTLIVDSSDILQFNGTFNATVLTESTNAVPNSTDHLGFFAATTSAQLAGVLSNETGTGLAVFDTTPTIATPVITGKSNRNAVSVSDDDCTGEQGEWWYDDTDSAFEFCNANSGAPTVLGNASFTASSSDTLTNKTYDVEGTGNVFTSVFHIEWQAGTCIGASASSNFDDSPTLTEPAAACVAGSVITSARLDFDKDTDEGMQISFVLPTGFTGTADFDFYWHGTPTANDVVWALETVCVADAETLDPSFNAAQTVTDTAKGSANQLNIATISTVTLTGCAAGERMFLQISRDANNGSDDFDADARLVSTRFTGRRTQ